MRKRTSTAKLKRQRLRFSPSVTALPAPQVPNARDLITKKSSTGLNRCLSRNEETCRRLCKHNGNITSRRTNIFAERFQTAGPLGLPSPEQGLERSRPDR